MGFDPARASKTKGKSETLDEVFLKLTNEEVGVADTTRILEEAFFKDEVN